MRVIEIFFRPPLAIARLGGADSPMDNYAWREDPTIHGAGRTVIDPAVTLEVLPDGSVWPFVPSVVRFHDRGLLRPVAPFFEVWARVQRDAGEPAGAGDDPDAVPLTATLLAQVGADLSAVAYEVHVANHKAARRTRDEADGFAAWVKVGGDDFTPRPLLASSPPAPGGVPLVLPDRPVPLGSFQVIRPVPTRVGAVDLDVLRVRFTPARGEVYGPPTAVLAQDDATARTYAIVPPANRVLNGAAAWASYTGLETDPVPADTYDGADQGRDQSWGVVDDTCDGVLTVQVVVRGRRLSASARIAVGPPDYAPDRRPFASLADDLADRDLEPATAAELLADEPDTQARLADLFQRVWETAGLTNVDAIRARALSDNRGLAARAPDDPPPPVPPESIPPRTDGASMRPADTPWADDKVRALIPPTTTDPVALTFTTLVALAHDHLAGEDELIDLIVNRPDRVRQMIRPAYGTFHQLTATADADSAPDPDFRDPRRTRDRMHDMRMPPYMRDEIFTALGLSHRQYTELMTYVGVVAAELERAERERDAGDGGATDAAPVADLVADAAPALRAMLVREESVPVTTPLARRVQRRLQQVRDADEHR